jgi:hypothetical protein
MLTSFIGWVLRTVTAAAEAEMDDDVALREQLLEAEMRRESGEISDEQFDEIEADLLSRIRDIRERRQGGSGPLTLGGAQPIDLSGDADVQIEANVTGDFHEPADAPHTTVIEAVPGYEEQVSILDLTPGQAEGAPQPGLPLSAPAGRAAGLDRRGRTARPAGTRRTTQTSRTTRTSRRTRQS